MKYLKYLGIALVVVLIVGAFVTGVQYQKQQSLIKPDLSGQNVSVEVVYYTNDLKIVDVTRHTLMLDHDGIGFFTNSAYVQEHNITQYWVRLYAINYNF